MINLNDLKVEREKMLKENEEISVKKVSIAKEILEKYFDYMLEKVFQEKEERNSLFIRYNSWYAELVVKYFSADVNRDKDTDIFIKVFEFLMEEYTKNGFTCKLKIDEDDDTQWGITFSW